MSRIYDANSWLSREEYIATKIKSPKKKKRTNKRLQQRKIERHNDKMKVLAKEFSTLMFNEPSVLERKMQKLLDSNGIVYDFQHIFYISKRSSKIRKFFIADFYIPSKSLIIETDGAFHDNQVEQDNNRTKLIQKYYPNVKVIRWRWHDFDSLNKVKELLEKVA